MDTIKWTAIESIATKSSSSAALKKAGGFVMPPAGRRAQTRPAFLKHRLPVDNHNAKSKKAPKRKLRGLWTTHNKLVGSMGKKQSSGN